MRASTIRRSSRAWRSQVEGLINRSAFSAGKPGSVPAIFNELYKKKTGGDDLDDVSVRGLQGFLVLADAINRAGSTEPAKIQAALKATDLPAEQMVAGYDGVKFDDKGQNMLAASVVTQMRGGKYVADLAQGARHRRRRPALQGLVSAPRQRQAGRRMSMTLVQVVVSGLLLGAVYALFSSGLTLIWGMMNVVNFAHGDFVMLGMYTAVMVWTALGGGPFAAVPIAAMLIATLGVRELLPAGAPHHEGADAGADPGHLRPGAVPALRRLLDLRRQLQDPARHAGRRLLRAGRHPLRGLARAGRRDRARRSPCCSISS